MKYYDENRNGYYNPDDGQDSVLPGENANWKAIQAGFAASAAKDSQQDTDVASAANVAEAARRTADQALEAAQAAGDDITDLEAAVRTAQQTADSAGTAAAAAQTAAGNASSAASSAAAAAQAAQQTAEGARNMASSAFTAATNASQVAQALEAEIEPITYLGTPVYVHLNGYNSDAVVVNVNQIASVPYRVMAADVPTGVVDEYDTLPQGRYVLWDSFVEVVGGGQLTIPPILVGKSEVGRYGVITIDGNGVPGGYLTVYLQNTTQSVVSIGIASQFKMGVWLAPVMGGVQT